MSTITAALVVGLVFGGLSWWRLRRTGYTAWWRQWKQVDRARRRRIGRTVRAGRAVSDPRDAALALEFIDQQERYVERTMRTGRVARWVDLALTLALLGLAIQSAARGSFGAVFWVALWLAPVAALRVLARRRRSTLRRARQSNAPIAAVWGESHRSSVAEPGNTESPD